MFGINKPSPHTSRCHDGSMFTRPPSREFLIILVLLLFSSLIWFCFSINVDIVQGKIRISLGKNSRIKIISTLKRTSNDRCIKIQHSLMLHAQISIQRLHTRSRHAAEVTSDPSALPSDITVRLFFNNTVVKVLSCRHGSHLFTVL